MPDRLAPGGRVGLATRDVGLEELLAAGEQEAPDAGLLVEHRREQELGVDLALAGVVGRVALEQRGGEDDRTGEQRGDHEEDAGAGGDGAHIRRAERC